MKTFLFLYIVFQTIIIPAVQNPPSATVEKTQFSSAGEWVNDQNKILEKLGKSQNRDLTMKVVKTKVLDAITILTLAVPHDLTGPNGSTIYKNGLIKVFIINRHLYIISPQIINFSSN